MITGLSVLKITHTYTGVVDQYSHTVVMTGLPALHRCITQGRIVIGKWKKNRENGLNWVERDGESLVTLTSVL